MKMTEYILDTFAYNDVTNRKLISIICKLPYKDEAVRLMSHLINCQYKWMARVTDDSRSSSLDWWEPLYDTLKLEEEWNKSLSLWLEYLSSHTDEEISQEVMFIGYDGTMYAATPKDIALQLNYHSIHHRAQMQTMIREQGLTPNFVDYIGTRYRKVKSA
jgi:uncharacterized damage-inducible protein DinB